MKNLLKHNDNLLRFKITKQWFWRKKIQKGVRFKKEWRVGPMVFAWRVRIWIGGLQTAQPYISFWFGLPSFQFLCLCTLFWRKTPLEWRVQSWLSAFGLKWWLFCILLLKATLGTVLRCVRKVFALCSQFNCHTGTSKFIDAHRHANMNHFVEKKFSSQNSLCLYSIIKDISD